MALKKGTKGFVAAAISPCPIKRAYAGICNGQDLVNLKNGTYEENLHVNIGAAFVVCIFCIGKRQNGHGRESPEQEKREGHA